MVPCDQDRNQFDPFASGYVQSLARPGGRVTGVFLRQTELAVGSGRSLSERRKGEYLPPSTPRPRQR